MEHPSVVIKVKYGDSLRRFHARIVNEKLDLSMDSLREKVMYLFSFIPGSELVLTYVDEDGDIVTLVNDEDLQDVVKQALNPLRITVKLSSGEKNGQFNQPSGSSIPLTSSPEVDSDLPEAMRTLGQLCTDFASKALSSAVPVTADQKPLHDLKSGLSQILKTVQEPVQETAVKLSTDLASKASGSSPAVAEIIRFLSKLGLAHLGQLSNSQPEVKSGTQSSTPESNTVASEAKVLGNSTAGSGMSNVQNEKIFGEQFLKKSEGTTKPQTEVNQGRKGSTSKQTGFDASASAVTSKTIIGKKGKLKKDKLKKLSECYLSGRSNMAFPRPLAFDSSNPIWNEGNMPLESLTGPRVDDTGASGPVKGDSLDRKSRPVFTSGFGSNWPVATSSYNSPVSGPGPIYECPFSGVPVANNPPASHPLPIRQISSNANGSEPVVHRTVRCDGCGVHPIIGSRFKSKVLVDYDLCSLCFSKMGNETEYIKMDRPAAYVHPNLVSGSYGFSNTGVPVKQQVGKSLKVKSAATILDSCFIKDTNIVDGTTLAPLAPFTKIWKMKNNGTAAWPRQTQLVWIGGDQLSRDFSVEVEIPAGGFPVGHELDVAVHLIAPKDPGQYISYWKMASPTGHKFGQRIWVVIKVDASVKENLRGFNLNLPPVSMSAPELINANQEPMMEKNTPNPVPSEKKELSQPNIEQEMKFPINDSLLVGSGTPNLVAPPRFSYPTVDISPVEPPPPSFYYVPPPSAPAPPPVAAPPPPAIGLPNLNESEETVLKKLEDMGFKQVELNKELLRLNLYDLQKTLDDLCAIAYDSFSNEMEFSMGQR